MARSRTTGSLGASPHKVSAAADRGDGLLTVGIGELAPGASDGAFRDFVADLFAAASAMQAVRRALAKATGLSGVDIAILLALQRLSPGGAVSVRAIADHLHLAGPQVTAGIGKLAEAGFAAKHDDPTDSRAVDVRLTAEGRRRLRNLAAHVRRVNDMLFAGMSSEEMAHTHRFLRRIVDQATPSMATLDRPQRKSIS